MHASGAVYLQHQNLAAPPPLPSPYGWRIGGAITDGAGICLLRIAPPTQAAFNDNDTFTLDITRLTHPGHNAAYQRLSTSPRMAGGSFYHASPAYLPPLPSSESTSTAGNRVISIAANSPLNAYFVPPESYLDPLHSPGQDTLNSQETCTITFRLAFNGKTVPGGRAFSLRRPPIVLVHGILSSPATWGANAYSEMTGAPVPTRLYYADYSATATKGYSDNFHVVPNTIAAALNEYRMATDGNHHPSRSFRGIRYAATRADVIGHSMGGQLARAYISNLDFTDIGAINRTRNGAQTVWPVATFFRTGTFGDRRYIRPDNWGAGDIRRLVTIGSPFKGSPLANAVEPWLEPTEDNFLIHELIDSAAGFFSAWELLYVNGVRAPGNYIDPTCVADLCVNSRVQTLLESSTAYPTVHKKVPWAPMVGIATQSVGDAPIQGVLWELLFTLIPGIPNNPTQISPLSPADSDLIVEQWSQLNAANESDAPNANLPWRFQFHTHIHVPITGIEAETESPFISGQIGELLSQPRSYFLNGVLH